MPRKERIIRAGVFRPGAEAAFEGLPNQLPDMQKLVGGYIQALDLSQELVLVCNEEGKLHELPLNRLIVSGYGGDWVVGTFFVVRQSGADFASLQPEDEPLLKSWRPDTAWFIERGNVADGELHGKSL